uniref:CRC domain-containing protein n=1 Tax=Pygocentrus nattereri TaxID=42514 RepID=A0AAR2JYY1_PYGNA
MDVVSPDLNSILPDEIMDTEAIAMEEDPPNEPSSSSTLSETEPAQVPMETEVPEIVGLCPATTPTQKTQALTTSTTTDSTLCSNSSGTQLLVTSSSSSGLKPLTTSTTQSSSPVVGQTLPKLSAPITLPANHQLILNKVAVSPAADGKPPGTAVLKQEGQKLLVTGLSKTGQPLVLALPHTWSKPATSQGTGDGKAQTTQFKVVTAGARTDLKPVIGVQAVSSASQLLGSSTPLQAQQLKTLICVGVFGLKYSFFFLSLSGRVLSQTTPSTPPRSIAVGESVSTVPQSISSSSSKVAISPLKSPSKTVAVGGVGQPQFKTIIPLATQPNVQQIQVPGSRFHYVRLVTATTGGNTPQTASPSTNTNPAIQPAKPMMMNTAAVRMSVPIVPAQTVKQVVPKPMTSATQVVTTSQTQQRLIMPATPLPQIQPNLTNLPPGTVLAPAPGAGSMGYAVLPAQYVTQLPQSAFVTLASSSGFSTPTSIQTQARLPLNGLSASDTTSRPRKPCNCTKSQCLKLYCDCFANGEFCNNCNCVNCFNNLDHESERLKAIKACLDRNPVAFKPKIGKGKEGESDRRHSKGCNCKKSGCLKNYCECYEAKIMCSSICKCVGCKNFEESPERKTLMHLADAAEVRVQQQTAAKTKLSSQISDLLTRTTPAITSGGGKLPYTFVTKEVAEATCDCLLEQAEKAELTNQPQALAERLILEEFGRCLRRIISFASKAKTDCSINC